MCNHENREAAMVRIQGTPVPGVTTKAGYCDPCLLPLIQALNDGGQYTFASCCGHGHRPGWIALADGSWLVVATEEQRHIIDAAFPVDINGRVWDQTEDGLAERVGALLPPCYITRNEVMPCTDWIGSKFGNGVWLEAMCCLPCLIRHALLADQPNTTAGGGDRG